MIEAETTSLFVHRYTYAPRKLGIAIKDAFRLNKREQCGYPGLETRLADEV